MSDFEDLTAQMDDTIVVAFTQRPDSETPEIDLTGTADYDAAIAITAKGFFMLMLDAMGVWTLDDKDDDDDDDEDEPEGV